MGMHYLTRPEKKHLQEMFKEYRAAVASFKNVYRNQIDISNIDFNNLQVEIPEMCSPLILLHVALDELPAKSNKARDAALKTYQFTSHYIDLIIEGREKAMRDSDDTEHKEKLARNIRKLEREKKQLYDEYKKKYGISLPV